MSREDRLAEFLETGVLPPGFDAGDPEELGGVRDLLSDEAVWADPPAGLAERIMAGVEGDPGAPSAGAAAAPAVAAAPASAVVPFAARRGRRLALALGSAAAILAVVALLVLPGDEPQGRQVALAGTDLAPEASATATVESRGSGEWIKLDVSGLESAPPGSYYQAWVWGARGGVPVGTFHLRGGTDPVILWAGVAIEDYPTITVTLEPEDNDQSPSGEVVLRGALPPGE